jgi:uncharacterized repeat protein (TIGR02543 family)
MRRKKWGIIVKRILSSLAFTLLICNASPGAAAGNTLTLAVNPEGGGTTTPAAGAHSGYTPDTTVSISAVPEPGYRFVNWTGPVADPSSASTTVVMTGDAEVAANFIRVHTLTMVVIPPQAGTCSPPVGTHVYDEGTVVEMSATAAAGYRFYDWSIYGDFHPPFYFGDTVVMDRDWTVNVNFVKRWSITLYINPPGSGSWVDGDYIFPIGEPIQYDEGTYVTMAAQPVSGYWYVGLSGDLSEPLSFSRSCGWFQMEINSDWNITANFALIRNLTVNINPPGGGEVRTDTYPVNFGADGYALKIDADPLPGYVFVNWTGDSADVADPNLEETTILMTGDKNITANFAPPTVKYALTVRAPSGEGSTIPAPGLYTLNEGTVIVLKATPSPGWRFNHWEGEVADPADSCTTVRMTAVRSVKPFFTRQWTLTLNVEPPGTGFFTGDSGKTETTGSRAFDEGTSLAYHAMPSPGWCFVRWSGDKASESIPDDPFGEHSFDAEMDTNRSVTADFAPVRTLTLINNPAESGSVTPASPFRWPRGFSVPITAEPNAGYEFVYWTGDSADVAEPGRPRTEILLNGDAAVTANYRKTSGITELGLPLPKAFALYQNYPNPFNPETKIPCDLPKPGPLMISVVGTTGRIVRTLVNRQMPAGTYEVNWDGRDDDGNRLPTGIYFCRMKAENKVFIKKMALTK